MRATPATIAANRFGYGATPGLLAEIEDDPQGWLLSQLEPETRLPVPLAALPGTRDDLTAFARALREARQAPAGRRNSRDAGSSDKAAPDAAKTFRSELLPRYLTAAKARFDAAVQSPAPFRERLVHFWSNHFVVSAAKPAAIAMPPSFERDVARSHVCGRFADMLTASCKHPAMTFYLDNHLSIGPNSRWGRYPDEVPRVPPNVGRPTGLNENLAREILELHTVGVGGGYTQEDVTSFARVITGWNTIATRRQRRDTYFSNETFRFTPDAHEPGAQTVMGRRYPQAGADQGKAVLADLARHPSTASFIATKLVRHFVADEPPPAAVASVAEAFLHSEGDLIETSRALVTAPEAWSVDAGKLKRPEEYLISAARALGGVELNARQLGRSLSDMGQRTYMSPGPDGWPDESDAWLGADLLWKRLAWASAVAARLAADVPDPVTLAEDVLGSTVSADLLKELSRAQSPAQGLTLLLVSAEFQRR